MVCGLDAHKNISWDITRRLRLFVAFTNRVQGAGHRAHFFFVGLEDHLLDVGASLLVERVRDVFELAVFALLGGHGDKEAAGAFDDLQIANHKTIVDGDGDVGFETVLVDGEDFHFGDDHCGLLAVPIVLHTIRRMSAITPDVGLYGTLVGELEGEGGASADVSICDGNAIGGIEVHGHAGDIVCGVAVVRERARV